MKKLTLILLYTIQVNLFAQNAGEVMFVGFNADGNDGFAFVTFVPLTNGTTIYFTDDNWNGSPIGGAGAFNSDEGAVTWINDTGNTISAGTVISISDVNGTLTISPNLGTATESNLGFNLGASDETLYMFLGSDDNTPTTFLSAIANDDFGNSPVITGTGLTSGVNAFESTILADEDVMVYTGSVICSSISACAAALSTEANWDTDDGGTNDHTDADFPNFPSDVTSNFYGISFDPVIYYSRNATLGGNWDDPNSWTTVSDGSGPALALGVYPASSDNVIILPGHTITIDAITDNQASGMSPDGLGRINVGPFAASNLSMFYHTGDILINGTLSISGIEMMLEGYTQVETGGVFSLTSSLVLLGFLEAETGSTLSSADDLVLAGNSTTIINTTSISNDDLIISFTDATLCGAGTTTLQNGVGSQITYANGGMISQICTEFTVDCTGAGCSGFPMVGTGNFISGNTGPGGVGNSNNNQLWVRAHDLSLANNDEVTVWSDISGNSLSAENTGGSTQFQRPSFIENSTNGFPSVSFDGGDILSLTTTPLNLAPTTDNWSFFSVFNVGTGSTGTIIGKRGASTGQFQYFVNANTMGISAGTITAGSETASGGWKLTSSTTSISAVNSWVNGITDISGGTVSALTSTSDVTIGARRTSGTTGLGFPLTGNIAEIAMYDVEINQAQRIIVDNYLAAKYGIDISASGNDFYTMDDNGNGDFDFEVAGIGQAADGSNHRDAKGTGVVRVWNPVNLNNNEYFFWGHDDGAFAGTTGGVDGTNIEERLTRIWRFNETGDVGNTSISFDLSELASPLGSNLRLLVDRDGDGFADNDVTPIAGSVSGSIVVFSGVNLQSGDRVTIGNNDASEPLPIELSSFDARSQLNDSVLITWTTASETNNDFFTIERSQSGVDWNALKTIEGAGTSFEVNFYEATDNNPYQGTSYYRLRQTDFDGEYSYSNVVAVSLIGSEKLNVFPNPTNGIFKIISQNIDAKNIKLFNSLGQAMDISISSEVNEIVMDIAKIPNGFYILQIHNSSFSQTVRLIKE